jgi:hypothetical protein
VGGINAWPGWPACRSLKSKSYATRLMAGAAKWSWQEVDFVEPTQRCVLIAHVLTLLKS